MNRIAIATLCCTLAGCGATTTATPNYDLRFGNAVREARLRMTLNPVPSAGTVAGVDGRAAHEAQERYEQSFRAPPPVVNVINIGGASGRGGQ